MPEMLMIDCWSLQRWPDEIVDPQECNLITKLHLTLARNPNSISSLQQPDQMNDRSCNN